ncbi:transposase [Micromonospora sp. NPDC050495]|uniref:transposase n=1 Tax=Micromonospora sp. NPDC050495 TaxID=3154936 RepID=UPI0033D41BF5
MQGSKPWNASTDPGFTTKRHRILDLRSHAEQDAAIGDYIRWRNQRVKPKSGLAADSNIRHPDYPLTAA